MYRAAREGKLAQEVEESEEKQSIPSGYTLTQNGFENTSHMSTC